MKSLWKTPEIRRRKKEANRALKSEILKGNSFQKNKTTSTYEIFETLR
jgi:hypothetical protein